MSFLSSFLEKLKKVHIHLNINLPITINITKDSNNTQIVNGVYYDKDKNILNLNPDTLSSNIKQDLPLIVKDYINNGNKLLENKSSNLLERLYQYNRENSDEAILSFFKHIIPSNDFEALNAALFLRNEFKKGENVHKLKLDIRKRFGDRGNNISNLCTASYFEEFLIPLYNSSKEDFERTYEDIIGKSMLAVFVNSKMEPEEIPQKISSRIEISKKYGVKFIHIHGISKRNVEKIKKGIDDWKRQFNFLEKKIYEAPEKDLIIVEFLFT